MKAKVIPASQSRAARIDLGIEIGNFDDRIALSLIFRRCVYRCVFFETPTPGTQGPRPMSSQVVPAGHRRYNVCANNGDLMSALKLTSIGNSVGVILPKELLAKLGVGKGDTLFAVETAEGIRLTTTDPEFQMQMDVARQIMKKRRAVLRELAK
jgi:putative addiction module antidote